MNIQSLTVALLVVLSFAYAAWTLMPQALRAGLARGRLRLPIPGWVRQRVVAASSVSVGCGCDGCHKAPASVAKAASPTKPVQAQPLVFHPRKLG